MNLGYIRAQRFLQKEKQKMEDNKKVKCISDLFADLITMGLPTNTHKRNINIYTCYETKLFERKAKYEGYINIEDKFPLQERAYFLAKRYIQIKDQYKGNGLRAGP